METEKKYEAYIGREEVVIYRGNERVRSFVTPTYKNSDDAVNAFRKLVLDGKLEWAGFTKDNLRIAKVI